MKRLVRRQYQQAIACSHAGHRSLRARLGDLLQIEMWGRWTELAHAERLGRMALHAAATAFGSV